ncbi:hypothetical protein BDR22DRAFT_891488 [Usnea florida]
MSHTYELRAASRARVGINAHLNTFDANAPTAVPQEAVIARVILQRYRQNADLKTAQQASDFLETALQSHPEAQHVSILQHLEHEVHHSQTANSHLLQAVLAESKTCKRKEAAFEKLVVLWKTRDLFPARYRPPRLSRNFLEEFVKLSTAIVKKGSRLGDLWAMENGTLGILPTLIEGQPRHLKQPYPTVEVVRMALRNMEREPLSAIATTNDLGERSSRLETPSGSLADGISPEQSVEIGRNMGGYSPAHTPFSFVSLDSYDDFDGSEHSALPGPGTPIYDGLRLSSQDTRGPSILGTDENMNSLISPSRQRSAAGISRDDKNRDALHVSPGSRAVIVSASPSIVPQKRQRIEDNIGSPNASSVPQLRLGAQLYRQLDGPHDCLLSEDVPAQVPFGRIRKLLRSLREGNKLNDDAVNGALKTLSSPCLWVADTLETASWAISRRPSRRLRSEAKSSRLEAVFMPWFRDAHWTLFIGYVPDMELHYYDPAGLSLGPKLQSDAGAYFNVIVEHLCVVKPKTPRVTTLIDPESTPRQKNAIDCGIYVIGMARAVAAQLGKPYHQWRLPQSWDEGMLRQMRADCATQIFTARPVTEKPNPTPANIFRDDRFSKWVLEMHSQRSQVKMMTTVLQNFGQRLQQRLSALDKVEKELERKKDDRRKVLSTLNASLQEKEGIIATRFQSAFTDVQNVLKDDQAQTIEDLSLIDDDIMASYAFCIGVGLRLRRAEKRLSDMEAVERTFFKEAGIFFSS